MVPVMAVKCSVKARFVNKKDVLENPAKYKNSKIVVLEVFGQYIDSMTHYYTTNVHTKDENKIQRVEFINWEDSWSEEAKNYMFHLRDKLAKAQGDATKENKDHLYKSAKQTAGLLDNSGNIKSVDDMNREEMMILINQFLDWLQEAEEPMEDILPQYNDIMSRMEAE